VYDVESRRLVALVSGAALLMGSLGAAVVAAFSAGGFLGSGGDPVYWPLVPFFLVVAIAAPFCVAAIDSRDGWLTRGGRALLCGVGVMILGFAFGIGGWTAAVGVALAVAVQHDDARQLWMRIALVLVASFFAFPALLFFHFGGSGYVLVPAGLAMGAIALADRLTSR
jgi:hypothetical protein